MGGRQLDRRRLALTAALFQSPIAGERDAALAAFNRLLQAGGATWDDLLAPLNGTGEERAAKKVKGRDKSPQQLALRLAREHGDVLSEWEKRFLRSVAGFRELSPKQIDTLTEIAFKTEGAGA